MTTVSSVAEFVQQITELDNSLIRDGGPNNHGIGHIAALIIDVVAVKPRKEPLLEIQLHQMRLPSVHYKEPHTVGIYS